MLLDNAQSMDIRDHVSREDFRDAMSYAMSEAERDGRVRPIRNLIARRRLRNERVFERMYHRVMTDAPAAMFFDEEGRFDLEAFFNWFVENLPKILTILVSFGLI